MVIGHKDVGDIFGKLPITQHNSYIVCKLEFIGKIPTVNRNAAIDFIQGGGIGSVTRKSKPGTAVEAFSFALMLSGI